VILKFGKYRGQDIQDVPLDYLEWLAGTADLIKAAREEIERRKAAEEASLPVVEKLIRAGYLSLAKTCHPDVGGTVDAMREVNAAAELLRELVKRGTEAG